MNGRRAAIGLSLFCALVFCAFAAPSAFAAKGTTAFTCKEGAGAKDFKDAHCTNSFDSKKLYGHEEIKQDVKTPFTASNANTKDKVTIIEGKEVIDRTADPTPAILHGVIAGLKGTFTCQKVHSTGTLTNVLGPPMKSEGSGIEITFSECVVSGELQEKQGCKLKEGTVVSKGVTSTTPTEAMEVEFKPEAGKPFATFNLIECKTAELNTEYKVTGTATAKPNGATLITDEESTKGLKLAGQQASFTSTTTVTMATTEPAITLTTTAS